MKKRGKRPMVVKETDSEDWCFVCKEGGEVRICDYRDCLKSYHTQCVENDEAITNADVPWKCKWHSCCICKRKASFHCYCCPKAVCAKCCPKAQFVVVRRDSGFCAFCLHMVSMIEENKDIDSDGETVDFNDMKTYEGLFKDYYCEVIKKKKYFTVDDVRAAKDREKKGEFDVEDFLDGEDEESGSDCEVDVEDICAVGPKLKKNFKGQPSAKKAKTVKSEGMQFSGWGTSRLISFLESIGQDTSTELDELEVENLIKSYAKKEKLSDPKKKSSKKILCDGKLQSLFGMKAINRSRIGRLLKPHFANNVGSEEEEEEDEEDEEEEEGEKRITSPENRVEESSTSVVSKSRRKSKEENDSPKAKSVCRTSKFAAIIAENIKLVYLRKSLLQELSKDPEAFEEIVTGSFIRVKTDPNVHTRKCLFELLQVTGVKRSTSGDSSGEMILLVSKMPPEIRLSSLSDGDFEEEECMELMQKVKDGLIPKPTVAELQKKARSLHVDITKHWIARELKLLDSRIDRANEQGRRKQLFDYLDERKLLQNPAEQSRLLETLPNVKEEELETGAEENEHKNEGEEVIPEAVPTKLNYTWGSNETPVAGGSRYPRAVSTQMRIDVPSKAREPEEQEKVIPADESAASGSSLRRHKCLEDPHSRVWLVATPSGKKEPGKYSLSLLKKWCKESELALKYKAWKESESEDQAILVGDAIKLAFGDGK